MIDICCKVLLLNITISNIFTHYTAESVLTLSLLAYVSLCTWNLQDRNRLSTNMHLVLVGSRL